MDYNLEVYPFILILKKKQKNSPQNSFKDIKEHHVKAKIVDTSIHYGIKNITFLSEKS